MNFLSVLYAKAGITVDGVTTLNNTATGLTPATNDNSTNIATTAFVKNQNYYPYPIGTTSQYVRGDGSLATFTQTGGGGSSVSYYLNGSVSQGTIGGNTYYEMSKNAIIGTNADFNLNADGYIAQFVTDAGDPALLNIPGGNWNFEMFFSASSGGGSPSFYVELYKYDGTTLTLIASGSAIPESITGGTSTDLYVTALAVPTTTLTLTDRLAVRVYVTHSGRTITLHTQNGHLCQVITTFTTGLTALNGLTAQVQNFAVGTSGSDFAISSVTDTHTFNLPTASATKRGALSSIDWSAFDAKVDFGDLSATAPLSYNGSGVFSIAQSSTSTNGYLSSTDWNTFNNKQNALTNPVTGTGTTNYLPKFTGTSDLGDSIISDNGSTASIGGALTATGNVSSYGQLRLETSAYGSIIVGSRSSEIDFQIYNTGNIFRIYNGSTDAFNINTSGNVGIGTTTPSAMLTLNATTPYIRIERAGVPTWQIQNNTLVAAAGFSINNITNATTPFFINGTNDNVGIGTAAPAQKLDVFGNARISSTTPLLELFNTTNGDVWSSLQAVASSGSGSDLIFSTKRNGDSLTEKLRITAAGNVGIGTTTIDSSDPKIQISGSIMSSTSTLSAAPTIASVVLDYHSPSNGGRLMAGSGGIWDKNILINPYGGNTLIGTTADAGYKLDVNGTARVNSNVTIGNGTSTTSKLTILATTGVVAPGTPTLGMYDEANPVYGFDFSLEGVATGNLFLNRLVLGVRTPVLEIARATGAATFSSSVTVDTTMSALNIRARSGGSLFLANPSNTYDWALFHNASNNLTFNFNGSDLLTLNTGGAATFSSSVTAGSFIKSGGTSAQFLKADGTIDSNVYLTATSSTFSYTASVTLSPTWQNTGVSSANLGTGAYLVTCNANDFGVGGGQYDCTYTGLMYFFAGATNGSDANEIVLHHTGHADNGRYIYLRTLNTVSADGKTYLQISGNGTNSGASNYQLTFKKLL